jgi:hypothetical protein
VSNDLTTIRMYWKSFLRVWIFPPAFFLSLFFPLYGQHPRMFFLAIDPPAFFFCWHMASRPVRQRQVRLGQGVVCVTVIPLLIWATLVFGFFGLLFGAGVIHGR